MFCKHSLINLTLQTPISTGEFKQAFNEKRKQTLETPVSTGGKQTARLENQTSKLGKQNPFEKPLLPLETHRYPTANICEYV